MARAWAIGAVAALLSALLFESALAWTTKYGPNVLPGLILLLAYVVIGAATGHASVSLTGGASRAWPAVVIGAVAAGALLGWGPGAENLHPMLSPFLASAGAGACTGVGGLLGLVLPNMHRAAAPPNVLANQRTVRLRVRPARVHHGRPKPLAASKPTPVDHVSGAPEILDFRS